MQRQAQPERTALTDLARNFDSAAVRLRDQARDVEAEAEAARVLPTAGRPVATLEDQRDALGRDADAAIDHVELDGTPAPREPGLHGSSFLGVLERVRQQIRDDTLETRRVREN